jgi:alanyl-tRNA synthetase
LAELLKNKVERCGDIDFLELECSSLNADMVKDIAFKFKSEYSRICFVAHGVQNDKVVLTLLLGDELVAAGKDASAILRQAAKNIKGGGGGQKHFASAGGKDASGLEKAVGLIKEIILA